jgi:hypothetical protein
MGKKWRREFKDAREKLILTLILSIFRYFREEENLMEGHVVRIE